VKRLSDVLGFLFVLAGFTVVVPAYPGLPNPMPSHWNAAGQVNGWLPKFWGALLIPIMMAVMWLIFLVLPRISPRGFEMEPFLRAWGILKVTVLGLMLLLEVLILRAANHSGELSQSALFVGLGILLVVIGNLLGKVTRNFFVGIRTPWTLASEEVWYRTHRLAGKLFVVAGLAVVASTLTGGTVWVLLVAAGLSSLIPVVYSYVLYKRIEGLPSARPAA
jgi:uncharacterized membrane protein